MELNVTPAAVGQLVRSLESWLGAPLFHRQHSGHARLVPTEPAEQVLPNIRAGFAQLDAGMSQLSQLRETPRLNMLTVTASPAFAAKWLLPRIENFRVRHPDTDIRLDTGLKLMDFATQGIDIGVRYGRGNWPGLVAEKFMDEEIYPVCSPDWLARNGPLASPADLSGKALIHDLSVDTQIGFASWKAWLEHAGAAPMPSQRGLRMNNSATVLQAAIDGHGVALARSVMAHDDITAGRLVPLFTDAKQLSELAYYIVYRPACAALPRLQAFRQWLIEEARRFPGLAPVPPSAEPANS